MVKHWFLGPRAGLVVAGRRQRLRRRPDPRRPARGHLGEVHRRRLARRGPHPDPGLHVPVHRAPVRGVPRQLAIRPDFIVRAPHREERVVVPVPGLTRAVVQAINVARSISDDVRAVYISDDPDAAAEMRDRLGAPGPRRSARRRRVAVSSARSDRSSPTSTSSTRRGRRTRMRRSPSSSSPSTSPATGGSGSSTTSRRSDSGRSSSGGRTRSSSTRRTGARRRPAPTRPWTPDPSTAAVRAGLAPRPPDAARDPVVS